MADAVDAVIDAVADRAADVRAGLPGRRVATDEENPSGERRLAADAHADELLLESMRDVAGVGWYASEERADPIGVGEGLSVAVDPLDGSSNLRSNNAMGTIVGVYDEALPAGGDALLAAAYVLYGPITTMVLTRGGAVSEYVIEDGERRQVGGDLDLPVAPSVYGFGGRVPDRPPEFAAFAESVEADESIKLRYGGAMVGDVNQVLTYGGIFAYPALESAPEGKLRRQFEAIPMAAVIEAAGGRSSDGERSLLASPPDSLHERTPVHLGNAGLIERLEDALA